MVFTKSKVSCSNNSWSDSSIACWSYPRKKRRWSPWRTCRIMDAIFWVLQTELSWFPAFLKDLRHIVKFMLDECLEEFIEDRLDLVPRLLVIWLRLLSRSVSFSRSWTYSIILLSAEPLCANTSFARARILPVHAEPPTGKSLLLSGNNNRGSFCHADVLSNLVHRHLRVTICGKPAPGGLQYKFFFIPRKRMFHNWPFDHIS